MISSILKNKKGNLELPGMVIRSIVVLFIIGIILLIFFLILTNIFTEFNKSGFVTPEVTQVQQNFLAVFTIIDYSMTLIMIASIISIAVVSYKKASPIIHFIIMFFVAAFVGFISFFFNFIFIEIVTDSAFASVINVFDITILICTNLHWIALIMIIVGSLTGFRKRSLLP